MQTSEILDNIFTKIHTIKHNISFDSIDKLTFSDSGLINFFNVLLFVETRKKTVSTMTEYINTYLFKTIGLSIPRIILNSKLFDKILLLDLFRCDNKSITILSDAIKKQIDSCIDKIKQKNNYRIQIKIDNGLNFDEITYLNDIIDELIDSTKLSKNIANELNEFIKKRLIVKFKSYHRRIIIRFLDNLNYSIDNLVNTGHYGNCLGHNFEKKVFKKITDSFLDPSTCIKSNVRVKGKFFDFKPEFDILIGKFQNNKYLIDTVIEVKNSINLMIADYKIFTKGCDYMLSNKCDLIDTEQNIIYKQDENQSDKINKCYIYKNDFNLFTSNNLLSNSIFKYLGKIKNDDKSKNDVFDIFLLLKSKNGIFYTDHKDFFAIEKLKNIIIKTVNGANLEYKEIITQYSVYKYK